MTNRQDNDRPTTQHSDEDTLVLEDRSLSLGFIQLPNVILHSRNLSRDAKLLYAILLSYAWQAARCFPGYSRLCEDMQASENMVRKYMRELESIRLLSQRRRGLGKTNVYTLHDLRTANIEVQEPQESHVPEPMKTEGKEDSREEYPDIKLRNSKAEAYFQHTTPSAEVVVQQIADSMLNSTSRKPGESGRTHAFAPLVDVLARRVLPHAPVSTQPGSSEPARPTIQMKTCLQTLSDDFGDRRHLGANLTQAMRLLARSGIQEAAFISCLYEARAITKDRQRSRDGAPVGRPMAYFWSVVRDTLGVTESEEAGSAAPSDSQRLAGSDQQGRRGVSAADG